MRTSTLARAGAVLTASALAFTLGTGPASAADDTTTTETKISTVPDASLPKVDWANAGRARAKAQGGDVTPSFINSPDLITFALATKNQVLWRATDNGLPGTVVVTPGDPGPPSGGYDIDTTLKYYGTAKTGAYLFEGFASKEPYGGVVIPDTYGPGLYSFGPSRIWDPVTVDAYRDDTTPSNTVRVRNATYADNLYTRYVGTSKKKVNVRAKVYRPSANIFAGGIPSVRLQYKSGSSWVTMKTIKLNKYGVGAYTWSKSTKRSYRILIPTTLSIQGGSDLTNGKGVYF